MSGRAGAPAGHTFNPTVVRLGPATRASSTPARPCLSIPLWCDWDLATSVHAPVPVRLSIPLWCDWDLQGLRGPPARIEAFNPTVVRLGRCSWPRWSRAGPSFNPTVVRLGHRLHDGQRVEDRSFQSHCGAIGTRRWTRRWCRRPPPFQSHCGAIGTHRDGIAQLRLVCFQSHCGAIGTQTMTSGRCLSTRLSIPLWCDWDPVAPVLDGLP